jgi:hypothetical protein
MWKLVVQFLSKEEIATSVKIEKELNKKNSWWHSGAGAGDDSWKYVEPVLNKVFKNIIETMIYWEHQVATQHLYLLQVTSVTHYAVKKFCDQEYPRSEVVQMWFLKPPLDIIRLDHQKNSDIRESLNITSTTENIQGNQHNRKNHFKRDHLPQMAFSSLPMGWWGLGWLKQWAG